MIADPTVEPYHALVTVRAEDETCTDRSQACGPSTWAFRQLTGGVDVDERTTSNHHLSTSAAPHHRHAGVDTSITLYRLGASTVAIRERTVRPDCTPERDRGDDVDVEAPPSRIVRRDAVPWHRVVLRGPVPPRQPHPQVRTPDAPEPTPWPSSAGLIGAGAAVAGAAAIAGVLGQPTLALFALVGGFVALTTWTVGAAGAWRRRRRGRRQHMAALERFDLEHRAAVVAARADHVTDHPAVTDVLGELDRVGGQLDSGDHEIGTSIWSRSRGVPPAECTAVCGDGHGRVR